MNGADGRRLSAASAESAIATMAASDEVLVDNPQYIDTMTPKIS